jgi:hypothetical protein
MEIEYSNPEFVKTPGDFNNKKEAYNLTEIIMNEVFNNENKKNCSNGKCKVVVEPEINEIDLDAIMKTEVINTQETSVKTSDEQSTVIFDLKKEVVMNDAESVVSGGGQLTKKRLLKLNLDKLKEKCVELNLSTDGTKAQLIERICEEVNKEV